VLRVALISGPAYDILYTRLPEFERQTGWKVEVAFSGPHPALNEHLAAACGGTYDLVSTHTKYAPSQAEWLLPLDEWISPAEQAAFFPRIIELSRINGRLMQVPRNLDCRLLHYRTDLIPEPPRTWEEFRATALRVNDPPGLYGTIFPGRHSGLFGTWYELLGMAGGELFDAELRPAFVSEAGEWALAYLHHLYAVANVTPRELPSAHYEEVAALFRHGGCAMILEWPGYYGLLRHGEDSAVRDCFEVARYPVGPRGVRRVYAGSHSFAIPRSVKDVEAALALLRFLTSEESQVLEGNAGSIVPRLSAWERVKRTADARNARRLGFLEATIRDDLLIPPKFAAYPQAEDLLWKALQAGVTGELPVKEALRQAGLRLEA
jgi:multiple sugar transport system substrate-binding protein